jgi:hypothetical protein
MVTSCYVEGKNCSEHNSGEKYHNISNPTVQQNILMEIIIMASLMKLTQIPSVTVNLPFTVNYQ